MRRLKVQFFQKGLLLAQFHSGVDQMKEWFKQFLTFKNMCFGRLTIKCVQSSNFLYVY